MANSNEISDDDRKTLFVYGITDEVDQEILYELFQNAGPLEKVNIPVDHVSKRNKPFAFVKFQHEESVPYAVKLFGDDLRLFGKILKLQNKSTGAGMNHHHRSVSAPHHRIQPFQPPVQQQGFQPPPALFQQQLLLQQQQLMQQQHQQNHQYERHYNDRRSHEYPRNRHDRDDRRSHRSGCRHHPYHDNRNSSEYNNHNHHSRRRR